jgi:L-lactate dehydrogenase complex protein LldG
MNEITSKERILKEIRNGLLTKIDNPFDGVNQEKKVLTDLEESIDLNFARELSALGGKFIFCENESEMADIVKLLMKEENIGPVFCKNKDLQDHLGKAGVEFLSKDEDLQNCKSGITECEFLIARFGSVLMSSALSSGRKLYSWPEIHLVVAYASQLVPELKDAIIGMRERYNGVIPSMITLVSGPSRTADIEKTLVTGVHGPKEIFVFYIDDLME